MDFLFFSCEAQSPAGYLLMELWNPIRRQFNSTHSPKEYSKELDRICFVFICTSEEMLANGFYHERKWISHKKRIADYRMLIPYLAFLESDKQRRWEMCSAKLYIAVKDIERKIPSFCADKLFNDICDTYQKLQRYGTSEI